MLMLFLCNMSSSDTLTAIAQQPSGVAGSSNYELLLDLLFSRDPLAFNAREKEFQLLLRFEEGHGVPHTQIDISKYRDGRIEVLSYRTRKGVGRYLRTDPSGLSRREILAAAKVIPVERVRIEVPRRSLENLVTDFLTMRVPPLFDGSARGTYQL